MISSNFNIVPNFDDISSAEEARDRFYKSATQILLDHEVVYEGWRWRISALELYLYHPRQWPDPTTHGCRFGAQEQLNSASWYVHRNATPSPNRAGIDITAGSRSAGIFAGLLVAAIGERDGSATALKTIARPSAPYHFKRKDKWEQEERSWLTTINGTSVVSGSLRLVPASREHFQLFVGPRKRLARNAPDIYRRAPLRLATHCWRTSPHMVPFTPTC